VLDVPPRSAVEWGDREPRRRSVSGAWGQPSVRQWPPHVRAGWLDL